MTRKKKILVDLDIVTVGHWDNKGKNARLAQEFMMRIEQKEFHMATPFFLIELVMKWKHETLKTRIKEFYVKYSDVLFTDTEIKEQCEVLAIDYASVLHTLESVGIKDEDAALILIASLFSLDCLVTFNRVHLRDKKEESKKILQKFGLPAIEIVGPEEI
ncbi:hypothetical protein HYV81_00910 [Candidatus Woesearchaeota archaeon]|nr:hypothetical protein [Candidatus Woesearchaeota archaeon]